MKNLKVLFLLFCFVCSFTAKAEPAIVDSKSDTEKFQENRDVSSSSELASVDSLISSEYSEKSEYSTVSNRFLEFGLEYPTSFGVNLRYLLTESIYARFGIGFMSEFFLNSFEKIADTFGYLSEEEAKLLSDTLKNSIYLDFRLAWAPYLKSEGGGPYLELGLSHSRYGKGELKGLNLSQVLNDDSIDATLNYSAKTNTYNASFHVGYQIPFEKVKLNFEIGLIKIFKTELLDETSIDFPELLSESQQANFQDFLETKGWIFPTFSGWISFAF